MGRSVGRSRVRRGKNKTKKKNKRNVKKVNRTLNKTTLTKQKKEKIKQIIDLNSDCLVKVFDFLSLTDLVNVSVTNPWLCSSARSVFSRKYAKDYITVTNETKSAGQLPSVALLVHFGDSIKKLRVKYKDDYHRFNHEFEGAIIEYCNKSVTEIEFINSDKFAFTQTEGVFEAVKEVNFTGCAVGKFIFEFNTWFPNVRSLEFFQLKILSAADAQCIEQNYPKLEHLGIINLSKDEYVDDERSLFRPMFSNVNVKASIHLNPQLKSLKLKQDNIDPEEQNHPNECGIKITPILLGYVNEKLPLLDNLDIMIIGFQDEDNFEPLKIHFRNLRKLRFVFEESSIIGLFEISTRLPTELTLTGEWLDSSCATFLSKNKRWSKIVLNGCWQTNQSFKTVRRTMTQLRQLKNIEMSYNGLIAQHNEVLSMVIDCKALNKLKICYSMLPWHKLHEQVDYYNQDDDDKRTAQIKLLDALKLLPGWRAVRMFMGDEDDIDDEDDDTEGTESSSPQTRQRQANAFLETFRKTYLARRFTNTWQDNYNTGNFYWAIYEKKNINEE